MNRRRLAYLVTAVALGLLLTIGVARLRLTSLGAGHAAGPALSSTSHAAVGAFLSPTPAATPSDTPLSPSQTITPPAVTASPSASAAGRTTAAPSPSGVGQESVPVIYDQSGQGNAVTKDFQVPGQWLIYWSYACTPAATTAGELTASVYLRGVDAPLKSFGNQAGSTSAVEHNFVGDDWYHLAITSSCDWRITVTPAPGSSVSPSPSK